MVSHQQFALRLGGRASLRAAPLPQHRVSSRQSSLVRARLDLTGPPDSYSLRDAAYAKSQEIVSRHFPSLQNLVENGSLVVHERRSDYLERREDGYQEPELVFILGTCHMSLQSAADVGRLIRTVQPENVVVEVCKSRISVLYDQPENRPELLHKASNPFVLSGKNFAETMLRTIQLGGPFALAFRVLMGQAADRVSHSFEAKSGVEMRSAQRAAEAIDAHVVLGDRPIEITLKRAMEAMTLSRRLALLRGLISGLFVSESALCAKAEEVLHQLDEVNEDLISQWTQQVTELFPELASPLIHERDLYLAWSMKRSKAVNGTRNVVGVVGRGHLKGTYYALQHDQGELRFKDLVGGRKQNSRSQMMLSISKRLAFEVLVGIACYFAWMAVSTHMYSFVM